MHIPNFSLLVLPFSHSILLFFPPSLSLSLSRRFVFLFESENTISSTFPIFPNLPFPASAFFLPSLSFSLSSHLFLCFVFPSGAARFVSNIHIHLDLTIAMLIKYAMVLDRGTHPAARGARP